MLTWAKGGLSHSMVVRAVGQAGAEFAEGEEVGFGQFGASVAVTGDEFIIFELGESLMKLVQGADDFHKEFAL